VTYSLSQRRIFRQFFRCANSISKTVESTTAVETKAMKPPNSIATSKIPTNIPPESTNTSTTANHPEARAATNSSINPSAETSPAPAPASNNNKATVVAKKSVAAPAPGVKHVRGAYSGKGWAPPQKEWESNSKQKGDKTTFEIEDEWDDDGNLQRTTTKHTTTPDWKKTTEKTTEIIPADEAEKMGLGRK
jgi:hypothetical protein